MNFKRLGEALQSKTKAAEATLKDLEASAQHLRQLADRRQKLESKVEDLEARIDDGQDRMGALKTAWINSHFREDFEEQNRISERRHNIQSEVEGLQHELASTCEELAGVVVPAGDVAETMVKIDLFKIPQYDDLLRDIESALRMKQAALLDTWQAIKNTIPAEYGDAEVYDDMRHEREVAHPSAEMKRAAEVRGTRLACKLP